MASSKDNSFSVVFKDFYLGFAPLAHIDTSTEIGKTGHAGQMGNADIITAPGKISQGPGIANLTDGNELGALGNEPIRHILDIPVTTGVTYAIADTKLHKITSLNAVTNAGIWPHAITNAVGGSSVIEFQGALYYFFNTAGAGEIGKFDLTTTFTDNWGSTVPTGAAALQNAPHPVAKKQDILLFGNGRYVGKYISSSNTLSPTLLDFGPNTQVVDIAFHANQWWIAVNSGSSTVTDRASSQIYLYDGAALTAILADEVAVGLNRIGFIVPLNGVVYVLYQELLTGSSETHAIGYISGRQVKPLRHFASTTLATFAQRTLYKGTLLFAGSSIIYSFGAVIDQLPIQLSQHGQTRYTFTDAIASPFGTPIIASHSFTQYSADYFADYATSGATWISILIPVTKGRAVGYIDNIVVKCVSTGAAARCDMKLYAGNADGSLQTSATKIITGSAGTRQVFTNIKLTAISDFLLSLDWTNGSTTATCFIREITVNGHYVEK